MQAPAIILDQVRLDFDGKPLFADLSLRFAGCQTTCLLGPSGCGKSTLLKLIAGAPLPWTGRIDFEPVANAGSRVVAWMGQNDLLLPWLSLLDNVLLGPRLRGQSGPAARTRALDLLKAGGLEAYADALPATLSGGMRQRGALLRTLMEERPVLLMDEPFSSLDALTRLRLQNLAARLTRNATVILVTHDPLEALRLADRIVVLAGTPVRVAAEFALEGATPRDAADPNLNRRYAELLDLLLDGEAT